MNQDFQSRWFVQCRGICLTVGLELLLATDIRIAATNTHFAQLEVKRGLYPFGGATIRFARETGWSNAIAICSQVTNSVRMRHFAWAWCRRWSSRGSSSGRAEELAQTVAAQAPLAVRATLTAARLAFTEAKRRR